MPLVLVVLLVVCLVPESPIFPLSHNAVLLTSQGYSPLHSPFIPYQTLSSSTSSSSYSASSQHRTSVCLVTLPMLLSRDGTHSTACCCCSPQQGGEEPDVIVNSCDGILPRKNPPAAAERDTERLWFCASYCIFALACIHLGFINNLSTRIKVQLHSLNRK